MSIQDVTDSACSHSSKSLNFIPWIKFVLSRFVVVTWMRTTYSWLQATMQHSCHNWDAWQSSDVNPLYWRASSESLVVSFALLLSGENGMSFVLFIIECISHPSCPGRAGRRASWAGRRAPPCSRTSFPGFGQGCVPFPLLPALASCNPDVDIMKWYLGKYNFKHFRSVIENKLLHIPRCRSWACPIRPPHRRSSEHRCCGGWGQCSQHRGLGLRSRSSLHLHHEHSRLQVLKGKLWGCHWTADCSSYQVHASLASSPWLPWRRSSRWAEPTGWQRSRRQWCLKREK